MRLNVITGGPGVGKSTIIDALRERGYSCIPEVARYIISSGYKTGGIKFQETLTRVQLKWEEKIAADFADRSVIDGIGYCNFLRLSLPRNLPDDLMDRYSRIFILEPLPSYHNDEVRSESKEEAKVVHEHLVKAYTYLGYDPIFVPATTVEKRVEQIIDELNTERERKFLLLEDGKWYCHPIKLKRGTLIRQGYLSQIPDGFSQLRIRNIGEEYLLTKKSGAGKKRRELEEKISKEEFERLWPQTEGRRVIKQRFFVNGFEIDKYLDRDLMIAEAENRTITIGKEVTGEKKYSNENLAK